jgi:quinol-cytochrome oxidoreductase complex cytochrome b subunit
VNFGFYSLLFLVLQILTGVLLAMFYNPDPILAFNSIIELIMKFIMDDFYVVCMPMELLFFL